MNKKMHEKTPGGGSPGEPRKEGLLGDPALDTWMLALQRGGAPAKEHGY